MGCNNSRALGANEWLGSSGTWSLFKANSTAVAHKSTHLKKSLVDSSDLPAAMIKLVPPGYECSLTVDGTQVADGLFACSNTQR